MKYGRLFFISGTFYLFIFFGFSKFWQMSHFDQSTFAKYSSLICLTGIMWDVNAWFEGQVSSRLPIRVWHLFVLSLLLIILCLVITCCLFNCRIPRTKQQILRKRKELSHRAQFSAHLKRIVSVEIPLEQGE